MIKAKVSTNYKDIERIFAGGSIQKEILKVWSTEANDYVFEAWKVLELEGPLPLTFKSNGEPLIDYRIYGNTVQNGTPTPENPIMPIGVGERTENIMDVYSANGNKVVYYSGVTFNFSEEPQCITINGQSTAMYPQVQIWGKNGVLHFENGKTYTALIRTTNKPKNSNIYILIQGCDAENNWSTIKYVYSDMGGISFSVSKDYVNFRNIFVCQNTGITYDNTKAYLMIIEGSTALPYEPYGHKLPILSNYTVTNIYLGEVETTRRIKKLVFDGTENWTKFESTGAITFYVNVPDGTGNIVLSTHFLAKWYGGLPLNNGVLYNGLTNKNMIFRMGDDTTITDVESFKSYLATQYAAGTPVTVWYVLAEPETAVVNEPLMKIGYYADTVDGTQTNVQIPTNKGNTIIDYDGEDHFITSDGYELVDKNQNDFLLSGSSLRPDKMYIKYKGG
jgi:hypothetical protein